MTKKYLINIGLAITLLYAGIMALWHPFDWIGFVPEWVTKFGTSRELALHLHSITEIVLGLWLLSNWKIKLVGWLVALDIAAIILVNGVGGLLITFRDFGLLFMAIYLAVADE